MKGGKKPCHLPEGFGASAVKKESAATEEAIQQLKDLRKKAKENYAAAPTNDADYMLMVCFDSCAHKERFLARINEPPDRRLINIAELAAWLRDGLIVDDKNADSGGR